VVLALLLPLGALLDVPLGVSFDDVAMVTVPAGEFLMGSDDPGADPDEQPASKTFVDRFQIDRVEVTNARYHRCVEAGACSRPIGASSYPDSRKADYPVSPLSWQQALAYCRWAGKRLPTEAEWEKAARGPDGRRYPWGDEFDSRRVSTDRTHGASRVGSYPAGASPYGALDMAGNVWEWTSSLFRPYPYRADDGREDQNAQGSRVNRGGSWFYGPPHLRASYRATANEGYRRTDDLGVRCAK